MRKQTEEWMKQSDYDMETADYMYNGGRYIYAVFMCHLSIEKALKGLFFEKMLDVPPKTHNLIYLLNRMDIKPPEEPGRFIARLSEASIPIRYPENLAKLQQIYTKGVVNKILTDGKECIVWIKQKL